MRTYSLQFNGIEEDLDFLYNTAVRVQSVDTDDTRFWMNDYETGQRVVSNGDILIIDANPEQEMILKLRFGDKIHRMS